LSTKVESYERHPELIRVELFVIFALSVEIIIGTGCNMKLTAMMGKLPLVGSSFFAKERRLKVKKLMTNKDDFIWC